jgi:uncharacterized protein (TIGR02466 family)
MGRVSRMIINTWFPTAIGVSECPFIKDIQPSYKKIISKYDYEKSGFCRERVHKNNKFNKLNKWVHQEVNKFAKEHLYNGEFKCTESWLLDYPIGGGQSFHRHPGFIFSAVFFLEGYENDTSLNFENPVIDMMNPNEQTAHHDGPEKERAFNELTFTITSYPPLTGRLVIWRSHLLHGCYNKEVDCKRIVFTYNFKKC